MIGLAADIWRVAEAAVKPDVGMPPAVARQLGRFALGNRFPA